MHRNKKKIYADIDTATSYKNKLQYVCFSEEKTENGHQNFFTLPVYENRKVQGNIFHCIVSEVTLEYTEFCKVSNHNHAFFTVTTQSDAMKFSLKTTN